jgi:two-component system sensor histidine kinase BaeS
VITNLLSNALKFTPPGGRVAISTRQDYPDAVLEVTDTGPGIPADELPHVFDRFWRGRQAPRPPAAASACRSRPTWPARTAAS